MYCSTFTAAACRAVLGEADPAATARASLDRRTAETSGFAELNVEAEGRTLLRTHAFAAGYAEGLLTALEVAQYYANVYSSYGFGEAGPSAALIDFVTRNDEWTRQQATANKDTDDYWHAVAMVLARFEGLVAGYQSAYHSPPGGATPSLPWLSRTDLLLVNLDGDLFDLQVALETKEETSLWRAPMTFTGLLPEAGTEGGAEAAAASLSRAAGGAEKRGRRRGLRCSAFFKVTGGHRDVLFGHDTWDVYAVAAPRLYKHVRLPVRRGSDVTSRLTSFSSSPGFIGSIDDWYIISEEATGTSLVVTETSVNIPRDELYKKLKPESVLCWTRMLVAGALAMDARAWTQEFAKEASGTYNNQWMVLDLTKFAPGRPLTPGTFWVLEEIPGLIHAEDQSGWLSETGFWASFNQLFYEETRAAAGADMEEPDPRARVFERRQGGVTDAISMKRLLGANDIMLRADLDTKYAEPFGGIDSKFSSASNVANGQKAFAIAGPSKLDNPPFCWEGEFQAGMRHLGHPRCFVYNWEAFKPVPVAA